MAPERRDDRSPGNARLGLSLTEEHRATYQQTPTAPGRGVKPVVACIVALACAGGLWFAYRHVHERPIDGTDIPIIRADRGATKMRPENPGGDAAPDEDNGVYTMGKPAEATEHLLPPPEEPMPKPTPTLEAAPPPVANPPAVSATTAPPPSASTAAASSPKPLPEPAAAPPPTSVQSPPKPVPAPATQPTPAIAGQFRVQIAATKDDAAANAEWSRLQKAHPDLLGGLSLTVVRADLGDRGVFFRIQAGPINDRGAADKLCAELKTVSIGCLVVRAQ